MAAAFQLYSSLKTFYGNSGELLAGGTLYFYEANTFTEKNVYAEEALTTNNGVTVALDASGRPGVAIWGSGAYDVYLKDSGGAAAGEDLNVQVSGGEATAIPALVADQYLTNDGAVMSWAAIREVPDPTGHSGEFLTTDGTTTSWSTTSNGAADLKQTVTAAASTTINYSLGATIQLNQAVDVTTLAFSNLPATGSPAYIIIRRVKDNSATARAITWPASVKWPGGVAPTLTQTANAVDVIGLFTSDGGTTFYGKYEVAFS